MHARVYSFRTIKLPLHDRLPNLARTANVGVRLPTQVQCEPYEFGEAQAGPVIWKHSISYL